MFKTYEGVSNPDMSVDEDGIQKTQVFQTFVYKNGNVIPYNVKKNKHGQPKFGSKIIWVCKKEKSGNYYIR